MLELAAAAGWPAVKNFWHSSTVAAMVSMKYDQAMVAEARMLILEGMT